jgi:hypothetical protein
MQQQCPRNSWSTYQPVDVDMTKEWDIATSDDPASFSNYQNHCTPLKGCGLGLGLPHHTVCGGCGEYLYWNGFFVKQCLLINQRGRYVRLNMLGSGSDGRMGLRFLEVHGDCSPAALTNCDNGNCFSGAMVCGFVNKHVI